MYNGDKYNAGIIGIGSYVPENIMDNYDMEKIVETSDEWIKTRTGISERRIVSKDQYTSDLALEASKKAIEDAKLKLEDIDLIIVATMSPDLPSPSTACLLQDKLGLDKIPAFDISAACSGFIYGLSVATGFIKSDMYKNILLVGAETMSRILDWKDRSTCVLFGDGAGAAVISRVPEDRGILGFDIGSDGSGAKYLYVSSKNSHVLGDNSTPDESALRMDGGEVYKFATRKMIETTKTVLKKTGMELEDLDMLVPHQANIRIVDYAIKKLKMSRDKVAVNLDKYGNMSAASIPIALDEEVKAGNIGDGDNILLVGFGGGLTWGSSILKWYKV